MLKRTVAMVGLLTSTAFADDVTERFRVEGSVGHNAPLGWGVEAGVSVTEWLSINAGVGDRMSVDSEEGPYFVGMHNDLQLAAMTRAHATLEHVELGGGLGYSTGAERRFGVGLPETAVGVGDVNQIWERAHWANAEVFAQTRGRLYLRGFAGAGALLNRGDCENAYGDACMQKPSIGRIYGGVGLGYRF